MRWSSMGWGWVEVRTCRRGASLETDCEGMLISRLWNDAVQNALVDTTHPPVAHERAGTEVEAIGARDAS